MCTTWNTSKFRPLLRYMRKWLIYVEPGGPEGERLCKPGGEWMGIEHIESPIRLSFSPYFSTYINHYPYNDGDLKNTTASVNGSMDVKYGTNESFTLDATLIPDFGRVQSDNQVLNLTLLR